MEKKILGKTGIEVSEAGFGVLPMGPGQYALPVDEGAALLKYAFENGFNFFDTAQYYRTYPYLRVFIDSLKKEGSGFNNSEAVKNLVICSKSLAVDYDEMIGAVDEALEEMGLDCIDIFLLHEVRTGQFKERAGAWEALKHCKAKGKVRAIGVSTHHINTAVEMAGVPECDVVFPLINFRGMGVRLTVTVEVADLDERSDVAGTAEIAHKPGRYKDVAGTADMMMDAIKLLKSRGKGVFTMKALGGGNLTTDYLEALDYVFNCPDIDSVMVGYASKTDIDDMLNYLGGTLDSGYNPDVSHKLMRVNQEDCIGCGACIKVCASDAISFSLINGLAEIDNNKCITCGYCAYACTTRAIIRF